MLRTMQNCWAIEIQSLIHSTLTLIIHPPLLICFFFIYIHATFFLEERKTLPHLTHINLPLHSGYW
jgi:hypothetical protein